MLHEVYNKVKDSPDGWWCDICKVHLRPELFTFTSLEHGCPSCKAPNKPELKK